MPVVQTVFDFECSGYGWSETWFKDTGAASLKQFYGVSAVPLAAKRAAMLAAEATLTAISCSWVTDKGDSYLRYENMKGNQAVHCDSPHATVYSILRANGDRYRKPVYIRGQDDNAVMNGGVFQPGAAVFVAAGTEFFDTICNAQSPWGWMRAAAAPVKHSILDYAVEVNTDLLVVTCSANTFVAPPAGQTVYAKVRILFKGRQSVLNGTHVVQVMSDHEFRLLKPVAVFPFPGVGTVTTYGDPTFVPAENWNFQKSGRRGCGRPKLHTPGRRRARALG